jgi:hypothetical protein
MLDPANLDDSVRHEEIVRRLVTWNENQRPNLVGGTLFAQRPFEDGRSICVPYDPARLVLTQEDNGTWRLSRHDGAIFRGFADREDAEAGLALARNHTQWCYIGKSNTKPDRERYIMEYLR